MRLKRDVGNYKLLDPVGQALSAHVAIDEHTLYALCYVTLQTLMQIRKESRGELGIPSIYTLDGNRELLIHPKPAHDYDLRLQYFPPQMEQ